MGKIEAARPEASNGKRGAPKVAVPGKSYKKRVYVHRQTAEIIEAVEKRKGESTSAFEAMFLVKMIRSKELTIEALRAHVQKLGREKSGR
jgi:hypothetical protein